jgi:hypothetical protein
MNVVFRGLKIIAWAAWLFVLASCHGRSKNEVQVGQSYSSTQRHLLQLLDNYKADYYASPLTERENIRSKYLGKVERYLVDSLERYIDSMTVIVDTVIQDDWLVTTRFHVRDIEFTYGLRFGDRMPPGVDSLYKFMTDLVPGQQVTVNFVHLGAGELNDPGNTTNPTMRIFAYPEPIRNSE